MKRLIFVIAFLLLTGCCEATTFGLHVGSAHDANSGLNSSTPGLFMIADNGATVGGLRNSYGRTSYYLGYTHEWNKEGQLGAGMTIGGITGYPCCKYMPIVVPQAVLRLDSIELRAGVVPKILKQQTSSAITFSVGVRF